ncbi:MAG: guanylate kinase [Planctomycetaceae bacterium]|jgi:guanylate kinase
MSDSGSQSNTSPIVVLSGPSGSGKTTVVERLVRESPVPLIKSVSATTRPPRTGEVHGDSYYFLADDEFRQKLDNDEFLEHAEVFSSGFLYGTLRSELDRAWNTPAWAFLEIDVQGAMKVMQPYPRAVTIFLKTPSPEEFERRLRARGTETEAVIQRRLATSARELEFSSRYRHVVVNDKLDRAVSEICEILKSEETQSHAG